MEPILKIDKRKFNGGHKNGGRKADIERIVSKEFEIAKAEFWVKLAQEEAIPKLRRMLKLKDKEPNAWKAAQEIMNRAMGKPTESVELSGKGGKDIVLNFVKFGEEKNLQNQIQGVVENPGTEQTPNS